jgi:hypothetical protein
MKRSLMLTAAAILLAGGFANADVLKGTYSFVGSDSCLLLGDPPGVASPANGGDYYTLNGMAQGFAIFNGDGMGTITAQNNWFMQYYTRYVIPTAV